MTPERFKILIDGVLHHFDQDLELVFEPAGCACTVRRAGCTLASVALVASPIGQMWRIEEPGRRARMHPSFAGAIATLREVLVPNYPAGRAVFVAETEPTDGEMRV